MKELEISTSPLHEKKVSSVSVFICAYKTLLEGTRKNMSDHTHRIMMT